MTIPDYQTFMLPLLKLLGNGNEHKVSEVAEALATQFNLSEEDKNALLPSGKKLKYYDRVNWAATYLRKASLLQNKGRGTLVITERGLDVLKSKPTRVDVNYLKKFPEFIEFQERSKPGNNTSQVESDLVLESKQTPRETLEISYQTIRSQLALDLLERVKATTPRFFERLVVDLLVAMGYGGSQKDAGQAVGQSGDGGIDGIIKEDKLGLDVVYIQAKKWESTVGRPIVQAFAGSLEGQRARKGVLITTSQFSSEAKDYVSRIEKKIVLIDGEQLAQLMMDHDVGVTVKQTYVVKEIDLSYYNEEQ